MCAQKTTPLNLARRHNAFSLTLRPANCGGSGSSDFVSMLVVGHVRGVGVGGGGCEGKEVIYWACICVCVCVRECVCKAECANKYICTQGGATRACVCVWVSAASVCGIQVAALFSCFSCRFVCLLFAFAAFAWPLIFVSCLLYKFRSEL